jgi:hypothetical protein
MEVQEVDVYIDQDGQVRLEVRGVKGGSCLDITAPLEQALGGQVQSRELTPEAHEGAVNEVSSQQRLKSP